MSDAKDEAVRLCAELGDAIGRVLENGYMTRLEAVVLKQVCGDLLKDLEEEADES